jgi:hypothetical protein
MKLQKIIAVGILLLLSAAALSAQNALPNPNDDACWSSLAALRACELQAYDRAMDQAQRCTSYPEYQCVAATEQPEQTISGKPSAKAVSATANNAPNTVSPAVIADTNTPESNSK